VLSIPIVTGLILYSSFPLALFSDEYISSSDSLRMLLLSIPLITVFGAISSLAYANGYYRFVLCIGIIANVPRIVLYFLLSPTYGGYGASLAYLLRSFSGLVAAIIVARKIAFSLKQFWSNATGTAKRLIIISASVTIIVSLALSVFLNTEEYVIIFDQLTATETSEIMARLYEMEAEIRLDQNGSIMVLKSEEANLRMALATEGYPKNGLSYYLIEQGSGMLATDYEKKQYVNMQLQERIAASIRTLDGVRDAIVTISIPDDDVFYLAEKEKPSASVILHIEKGNVLTESQVMGIQNLVVKSVPGLSKDDVAISDSTGNELWSGSAGSNENLSKINITREIENDIRKKIATVLEGPYDSEQFRISVTASVNMDNLIKEETLYAPSIDGNNTGVIKETTRNEETSSSTQSDGGIPGTSSNSEVPTYPAAEQAGEGTYSSVSGSTVYQISQIISQYQKSGAIIESVSIGIAIDKDSFATGEQESIIRLISYAVGVQPENIAVENFKFSVTEIIQPLPPEDNIYNQKMLIFGMGGIVLLLVGIAVVIIVMRQRKKGGALQEKGKTTEADALEELFGKVQTLGKIESVTDSKQLEIKEFAKKNPEIAAQMIRSWLRSEEETE
ncbi:MAG: flagellar M-ring protein FliF, partial [Erysipelotrichales bacterium]